MCMKKSISRSLLASIREAEYDAKNHPHPEIITAYSLTPYDLSSVQIKLIKEHIELCRRCRKEVEDTKAKSRFFSQQKTLRGGC